MCELVKPFITRGHDVPDVAQAMGVHPRTIYREIAKGNLRCIRVGRAIRVTDEQLADYLKRVEA